MTGSKSKTAKASKASTASIKLLSKSARIENVAPSVIDLYPAITRTLSILNGSALHMPLDLQLNMEGCYALVLPHPTTVRKSQIYPEVMAGMIPPGGNKLEQLTIRNHNFRSMTIDSEQPIARMVIVSGIGVDIDLQEFVEESEDAA